MIILFHCCNEAGRRADWRPRRPSARPSKTRRASRRLDAHAPPGPRYPFRHDSGIIFANVSFRVEPPFDASSRNRHDFPSGLQQQQRLARKLNPRGTSRTRTQGEKSKTFLELDCRILKINVLFIFCQLKRKNCLESLKTEIIARRALSGSPRRRCRFALCLVQIASNQCPFR